MGITLTVFKIVGNIPVEKDKLHIDAILLHIVGSWIWCKILVEILLASQDLLMLRGNITLQISSLFVAFIMEEPLFSVDKNLLNDLFENLIFDRRVSAIDVKKLLKVFAIVIGSLMHFSSFQVMDSVSFFFFFFVLLTLEISFLSKSS